MQHNQTQNSDSELDLFLCEIDKTITSGNITFINNAIKKYDKLIDNSYIVWANSIALQIVEDNLEVIAL